MNEQKILDAIRIIIEEIGENPDKEGLKDTPKRVMKMFKEIYKGIGTDPKEELNAIFDEQHEEMVVVKDIPFYSTCEHHLVPFFGKVHIGYIPNGKVVGLSKLVRLVDNVARRVQLQERMTSMIGEAIMDKLAPQGVIVVIKAEHMCISMRGINKPGSQTMTVFARGKFEEDLNIKNDFFEMTRA